MKSTKVVSWWLEKENLVIFVAKNHLDKDC